EAAQRARVVPDDRGGKLLLLPLEKRHLVLNRSLRDEAHHRDRTRLTDAMGAIGRLILGGGIPPRIAVDHRIGAREVQPGAPGLEGYEKERCRPALESRHGRVAIAGRSIEVLVGELRAIEVLSPEREELDELRENERSTFLGDELADEIEKRG